MEHDGHRLSEDLLPVDPNGGLIGPRYDARHGRAALHSAQLGSNEGKRAFLTSHPSHPCLR